MKIEIKQGNHLSNQVQKPRLNLFSNGEIVAEVTFTKDSIYDLGGDDQFDWNKLAAGASWGFLPLVKSYQMHYNSSRWGWRYNTRNMVFELTPYFYINGIRHYAETIGIQPISLYEDVTYKLIIKPSPDNVRYTVIDTIMDVIVFNEVFDQFVPSLMGWSAAAYFGGNKPAPNDISYELNYL